MSAAPSAPDAARPAPLTPADCDLSGYDWFPLKHKRLLRSTWWLRASDRAKALNIELWCAAYQETPAASLPDDDLALSDMVGFGRRDLTAWLAVKDEVMAPWVLCSDGRWYHPTLAEVAIESHRLRQEGERGREGRVAKAKRAAEARWGKDAPGTAPECGGECPEHAQASDGHCPGDAGASVEQCLNKTGQDRTEQVEASASPSAAPGADGEGEAFASLCDLWAQLVARGRCSRVSARQAWDQLSPADRAALPGAVRRYGEAKPWGSHGTPALQRWIGEGMWRDFAQLAPVTSIVWAGPAALRAAVIAEAGEPFARSYLDPSEWRADARDPVIVALTGAAAAKLRPLRALAGVTVQDPVILRRQA